MILLQLSSDISSSGPLFAYFAEIVIFVLLLLTGLIAGRHFEKKHLNSLNEAESELGYFCITNGRNPVGPVDASCCSCIVEGQVVIANDYLKSFLSHFRMIFGGEMKSYDRLMMRARREAIVRMMRDAERMGYNAVCNIRMDFSSIVSGSMNKAPAVEVLVTGTAYKLREVKN